MKKTPTESEYFAKVARMVKRSKGKYHLAEYDSAGDCKECGECGRCPGYHGNRRT